jgi:hypothetical protein
MQTFATGFLILLPVLPHPKTLHGRSATETGINSVARFPRGGNSPNRNAVATHEVKGTKSFSCPLMRHPGKDLLLRKGIAHITTSPHLTRARGGHHGALQDRSHHSAS